MAPAALRYLSAWAVSTLALLSAVVTVNLVVDPYGLFRMVDVPALNHIKSHASERAASFKHMGVKRIRPAGLVLGNSRAEIGFDPESPSWPESVRPVFNLALPGAGIHAVAGDFAETLRWASPELVVVGLDFLDFRVDPLSDERFTPPQETADPIRDIRERASALLTLNALADSLATIKAQHDPYSTSLTEAGFNPKRDYIGVARREGYFAMFRQRNQENARAYLRGPKSVFQTGRRPAAAFDALDHIIARARARHNAALRDLSVPRAYPHALRIDRLVARLRGMEARDRGARRIRPRHDGRRAMGLHRIYALHQRAGTPPR